MNEDYILIRFGEISTKGKNRKLFVDRLKRNIKMVLRDFRNVRYESTRDRMTLVLNGEDAEAVMARLKHVFGIVKLCKALEVQKTMESVLNDTLDYLGAALADVKTFKVEAKRADKNFPVKSPEIGRIIGAKVLVGCKVLKVDVHDPDVLLKVDVRHDRSYIYDSKVNGLGGLPLGTNGKGMTLLSGGIDSPVATWMMAKRGMMIEAVHYHSYPYTSERAREKVIELAQIVSQYTGKFKMHVINLLPIQEEIVKNCPEEETTIHVRRFMMRIAEKLAQDAGCQALITGEDLGQVASQTAEALVVTDSVVSMPVFRPLIGMDKIEIMDRAQEIGTYEKSIEPYEDCCTVFLPKHPATKPRLDRILESESRLDVETLVANAVASQEIVSISPEDL